MRHLTALGASLVVCAVAAAEPVAVKSFVTQTVGDALYFRVEFTAPVGVADDPTPRLVPQDAATRVVVRDGLWGLKFVGKWSPAAERASLQLLYTVREQGRPPVAVELPVSLARADAASDNVDLRTVWAAAQMVEFGRLRKRAPDFNFYPLAQLLLARKYCLAVPADLTESQPTKDAAHRQIFETYTGGAAVAESLQLHRLLSREPRAREDRAASVDDIPGINIPEHPWVKMMGTERPAPEPLAHLIPADNYYVRFRDLSQLLAFGDLLELWGANLIHAFEFQDRDAFLRARYERQLCLPTARVAKALRPEWVKAVAVTGSDPYLADGTDVTVIIQTPDPRKLLLELDAFVVEARTAHRDHWREESTTFQGTTVESFTTPLREVSLHRASAGEYVICSNSRVALERVLLARRRAIKDLSQSLDFQYMRTVFRADDAAEDGFAFLPDAFIRRLMGPADKIKQQRRADALGRLALTHTAALFAGWDTGKLPTNSGWLTSASGLKADDFVVAEGKPIVWDGPTRQAYSEAYNTLAFATPLIELEIDKVTPRERQAYEAFRRYYLQLWNQFFDPVGMRFRNGEKRVQLEAYVLPLIQSERYRMMRQIAGGEPYPFDRARTPPNTLMQLQVKLADAGPGTWLTLRLDDDPAFAKRMELLLRRERNPGDAAKIEPELERAFWRLPLTIGLGVPRGDMQNIDSMRNFLRGQLTRGEPNETTYRDVTILRYVIDHEKARETLSFLRNIAGSVSSSDTATLAALISFLPQKEMPHAIYQASLGDGYYLSLREDCLKRIIDHEADRQKRGAAGDLVLANASLFVAPSAKEGASPIRQYLEWQTHKRALAGTAVWLPLYRSGAIASTATDAEARAAALQWYGFEPISPDGAVFRHDRRRDEVVNTRHGSPRDPAVRPTLAPDAPVRKLMDQFRTLRTDLKFREDGIHTTVTFERMK